MLQFMGLQGVGHDLVSEQQQQQQRASVQRSSKDRSHFPKGNNGPDE